MIPILPQSRFLTFYFSSKLLIKNFKQSGIISQNLKFWVLPSYDIFMKSCYQFWVFKDLKLRNVHFFHIVFHFSKNWTHGFLNRQQPFHDKTYRNKIGHIFVNYLNDVLSTESMVRGIQYTRTNWRCRETVWEMIGWLIGKLDANWFSRNKGLSRIHPLLYQKFSG